MRCPRCTAPLPDRPTVRRVDDGLVLEVRCRSCRLSLVVDRGRTERELVLRADVRRLEAQVESRPRLAQVLERRRRRLASEVAKHE